MIAIPLVLGLCVTACPFEPDESEGGAQSVPGHSLKTEFTVPQKFYARQAEDDEKTKREKDFEDKRVRAPEGPTSPDPLRRAFTMKDALAGLAGNGKLFAVFETSLGNVECEIFEDKVPVIAATFIGLARGTRPWWDVVSMSWVLRPYYDNTDFLQIFPPSFIRGGCPEGNCMIGCGFSIPPERNAELKHDQPGRLSMLFPERLWTGQISFLAGPFPPLDEKASVFGQCAPIAVIQGLIQVPVDNLLRPEKPIKIVRVTIERRGN